MPPDDSSGFHKTIDEYLKNNSSIKTIGEIATEVFKGSGINKEEIGSGDFPCVRFTELYTDYEMWFYRCISTIDKNLIKKPKFLEYGDIILPNISQVQSVIGKSCAYLGMEKAIVGDNIVVIRHNQNPKYLAYALSTKKSILQKINLSKKAALTYISPKDFKKIKIPLPSLEIQAKVVEVLDKFKEIELELQREIKNRKKQYEYYRDLLTSLGGGLVFFGGIFINIPQRVWL